LTRRFKQIYAVQNAEVRARIFSVHFKGKPTICLTHIHADSTGTGSWLLVIAFDCLLQPWHTAQYKTSGCVHLDILKSVFLSQNMEQTLFISSDATPCWHSRRILTVIFWGYDAALHCRRDGFGGLVVSTLSTGTRVRGFKPGPIFRASGKSSVCLPSERK
jgi:hypothetical protein